MMIHGDMNAYKLLKIHRLSRICVKILTKGWKNSHKLGHSICRGRSLK